jgi:hypothetical protein
MRRFIMPSLVILTLFLGPLSLEEAFAKPSRAVAGKHHKKSKKHAATKPSSNKPGTIIVLCFGPDKDHCAPIPNIGPGIPLWEKLTPEQASLLQKNIDSLSPGQTRQLNENLQTLQQGTQNKINQTK